MIRKKECRRNSRAGAWAAGLTALAIAAGGLAGCGGAGDNAAAGNNAVAQEQGSEGGVGAQESAQTADAGDSQERQREAEGGADSAGAVEYASAIGEDGKLTIGDIEVSVEPDDEYTPWDESVAVRIELDDSGITIDGQGARAQGSTVTIEKSGTYILSGTLSDGTILVDAGDEDSVRLVLDGVDIHSETSAPIDIKKAGKAVVSLEEGSVNTLSDSPTFVYRNEEKEEPNGTLFSKNDLTINGSGTLKVTGTFNNGICSKDILKITGGTIEVQAANHGVKGNDALIICGGQLNITATGDGVKSDTLAAVLAGDIVITDCEEGLEAETVAIYGGTIDLTARDDGINASTDGTNTPRIYLAGGTVTVRAEGDGIDSNGSIYMSGGNVTVYGPTGRGNGAIDYDREFVLTGGTLAAFGPGGMEQNVSTAESQVSVLTDFQETQKAGTVVILKDKEGKELYKGTGEKDFRTILISTPEIEPGGEYELEAGAITISLAPEQTVIYANQDGVQSTPASTRQGRPNSQGHPDSPGRPDDQDRPDGPGRPDDQGHPDSPGRPDDQGGPDSPGRSDDQSRPDGQDRPGGPGRPDDQDRPNGQDSQDPPDEQFSEKQ